MPFAFLCLEVYFAIKDRIIEQNYYRSLYLYPYALEGRFNKVLKQ